MVHTGVARPYSACRSGSGLNEGLGLDARRPKEFIWQHMTTAYIRAQFFRPKPQAHNAAKQQIFRTEPGCETPATWMHSANGLAANSVHKPVFAKARSSQVHESEPADLREQQRANRVRRTTGDSCRSCDRETEAVGCLHRCFAPVALIEEVRLCVVGPHDDSGTMTAQSSGRMWRRKLKPKVVGCSVVGAKLAKPLSAAVWPMRLPCVGVGSELAIVLHDGVEELAGVLVGRHSRPNVRAKLPAEACAVSPVRDDASKAADRAYSACRSGSA